jgi:hypothetical protein
MENVIEFRLILAVKPSILADVFNVAWNLNRSNDGQPEDRAFRIYVRGRQTAVQLVWILKPQMQTDVERNQRSTQTLLFL